MSIEAPDLHDTINQLQVELANIHRVHIDDIRALMSQFETEKATWEQKLQEAVGRECGALCGDIEQDREELTREIARLREEGVPGVMHEVDQMVFRVLEGDRDRFANLHRNLVERQRRVIGEYRAAKHAARSVRLVEGLLADALGREPGSINGDNIEDVFADLVKERDHYRDQLHMLAAPGGHVHENERIIETLRHGIGEAVSPPRDIPRDQIVPMVDQLVAWFQSDGDVSVPDRLTQERLEEMVGRLDEDNRGLRGRAEEIERAAVDVERRLRDTKQRADAAEEQVRRYADEAARREAEKARAHANWAAEMTAERARYAGLESASQAVGRELTWALSWCDRMRTRRVADTDLMRRAYSLIVGAHLDDAPNVDLRERAREWVIAHETREQELRTPSGVVDPLTGFAVRVYNDGRHERVQLVHRSDTCRYDTTYRALPSTEVDLAHMLDDAYQHALRPHVAEPHGEASPGDGDDPCGDTCYNSHGVHCPDRGDAPTEVNE